MRRTPLRRKAPLSDERRIRQLGASEPDPPGVPRRYVNGAGYVRLRWKVGKGEYVERYERDDSGAIVCERVRWRPGMSRKHPLIDLDALLRLHDSGLTEPEVAVRLGCDVSVVHRRLRELGRKAHHPKNSRQARFNRELDSMRPILAERSKGLCEAQLDGRCSRRATHVHHRKGRRSGDNSIENLLHLCASCHSRIHRLGGIAYLRGWLVESWNDPAAVPVKVGLR